MTDRRVGRVEMGRYDTIPYKGGPRAGKNCRPRQRQDSCWAVDATMGVMLRGGIKRGQYEYRDKPQPHMLWVENPEHQKVSAERAKKCQDDITTVRQSIAQGIPLPLRIPKRILDLSQDLT